MELEFRGAGNGLLASTESSASFLSTAPVVHSRGVAIELEVQQRDWWEGCVVVCAALLTAACALAICAFVFVQVFSDGSDSTSFYKLWLIFALMAPLTLAIQKVFDNSRLFYDKAFYLRAVVDSMRAKALYNAVCFEISEVAEKRPATSSPDVEAHTEYDRKEGRTNVKLRYWGWRSKQICLAIQDEATGVRTMYADYDRGEDVVSGRDHSVNNRETIVLRLVAGKDRLQDKAVLIRWFQHCVRSFEKPAKDVVEVLALDQSSTDWVPEWKIRVVRPMRRAEGVGQHFFLSRASTTPVVSDACTWFGKELRCYLIVGPPGTGKTELTIWLAGYLGVPLYRLSLNDPRLSDQLFAQLVSPTGLCHDNAVLQIDEFQETLSRWAAALDGAGPSKGVSMGGFCEVLQGSNSLSRGFIILSGTQRLERKMMHPRFSAVFRRIAETTQLGPLSLEDLKLFFQRFLADFVPGCPMDTMLQWAESFVIGPWGAPGVSIDMVKQFLMKRISSFRAKAFPRMLMGPDIDFHIPSEKWQQFSEHLCDGEAAKAFLKLYPPVHEEAESESPRAGPAASHS